MLTSFLLVQIDMSNIIDQAKKIIAANGFEDSKLHDDLGGL